MEELLNICFNLLLFELWRESDRYWMLERDTILNVTYFPRYINSFFRCLAEIQKYFMNFDIFLHIFEDLNYFLFSILSIRDQVTAILASLNIFRVAKNGCLIIPNERNEKYNGIISCSAKKNNEQ